MSEVLTGLAVKIAILRRITNTPIQATDYSLDEPKQDHQNLPERVLSPKHEENAAGQLAFVCAYSKDSSHVLAVCLEERASRDGLVIRLAVNAETHERLVEGVKSISGILQQEAQNVCRSSNYESLLKEVVALNGTRILSRMRSSLVSDWRTETKPLLVQRLETALELLRPSLNDESDLPSNVTELRSQADILEDMSREQIGGALFNERLMSILRLLSSVYNDCGHEIRQIPKAESFFQACDELLRCARKYPIFSHIEVCFANLQQSSRRSSILDEAVVDSIINYNLPKKRLAKFNSKNTSIKSVKKTIKKTIKAMISRDCLLHAEIQLLLFYEQNPRLLRPRAICSSKSACYLCHLFFTLHGQYIIPTTHGVLYPAWKWPTVPIASSPSSSVIAFKSLLPQFCDALDAKIIECLPLGIGKFSTRQENRSDLGAPMTASNLSQDSDTSSDESGHSSSSGELRADSVMADGSDIESSSGNTIVPTRASPEESPSRSLQTITPMTAIEDPSTEHPDSSKPSEMVVSERPAIILREGGEGSYSFIPGRTATKILVRTPKIKAYLDISSENAPAGSSAPKPLKVDFDYSVDPANYDGLPRRSGHTVDVEHDCWTERAQSDGVLFSKGGLVLKAGDASLRLRATVV